MKALIISILVTMATFVFGTKPFVRAVGGRAKMWVIFLFDLTVGALTYALVADERRFCDSTPRSDVCWKADKRTE